MGLITKFSDCRKVYGMAPLLFSFLALPFLSQAETKGLGQLISEEDKFHLLTEVG